MMPGQPVKKAALGTYRFHIGVQCTCGGSMHYAVHTDDLCEPGEMTCMNSDCNNFGNAFQAPVVDVLRTKAHSRKIVHDLNHKSKVAVRQEPDDESSLSKM